MYKIVYVVSYINDMMKMNKNFYIGKNLLKKAVEDKFDNCQKITDTFHDAQKKTTMYSILSLFEIIYNHLH